MKSYHDLAAKNGLLRPYQSQPQKTMGIFICHPQEYPQEYPQIPPDTRVVRFRAWHHSVKDLDLRKSLGQDEERRIGRDARRGEASEGLALADDAWRPGWHGMMG